MGRGGHSLTAGSFVRLDHEGPQGVDRPETRQPHMTLSQGAVSHSRWGVALTPAIRIVATPQGPLVLTALERQQLSALTQKRTPK